MLEHTEQIIKQLKEETNELSDIIYRKKIIHKKNVYIIYNEPLTSSDKISDFIIRSLTHIEQEKYILPLIEQIENDISNFKVKRIDNYSDLCFYLHKGFTLILVEAATYALALETKANIARGIKPNKVPTRIEIQASCLAKCKRLLEVTPRKLALIIK